MAEINEYLTTINQHHWLNVAQNNNVIGGVVIIVPVYNGFQALKKCTKALIGVTENIHPIVFLNDASTDHNIAPFLDKLSQQHRHITVLHRPINLGYLHNINQHLATVDQDVLLLNADTEVTPGWIDEMIYVANDERVGAVCPLSNNATLLTINNITDKNRSHLSNFSKQWYPIPTAVGFCLLIKQQVLKKLGSFDPFYHPGYGEECDYSMLIRQQGWQVACAPAAFVYHQGSASFQQHAPTLQTQHQKLLDLRWPHYTSEVSKFLANNPSQFIQLSINSGTIKNPKILHVVHGIDNKGGVELFTQQLINQFDNQFHHTLLIPQRNKKFKPFKAQNFDVIELSEYLTRADNVVFNRPADLNNKKLDQYFKCLLTAGEFKLVHFHSLVGTGTAVWPLICKQLAIPYQLFFHDHYGLCQIFSLSTRVGEEEIYCGKNSMDINDSNCVQCIKSKTQKTKLTTRSMMKLRAEIWQNNITFADKVYFPSHYLSEHYQKKYPVITNKSVTFSPCFYPTKTTACKTVSSDKITIAFLGQFGVLKGAQLFIDLYHAAKAPNINWQIIGGVDPKYQPQLAETDIKTKGSYQAHQIPKLLSHIDLVVFTSQFPETYGITLTEAWLQGIPVIAPNIGVYPNRIQNGFNGQLYQANDLDSLTDALHLLIEQQQSSNRISSISIENNPTEKLNDLVHSYQTAIKQQTTVKVPQHHNEIIINKPKASAYHYMQHWLDSPMTLEAAADWLDVARNFPVLVLGDNASKRQITTNKLQQILPSPQIFNLNNIASDTFQKNQFMLVIEAGHLVNDNMGNWLAAFQSSLASISLADFALINQQQQSYAPQFQGRFSWANFKAAHCFVGALLINCKHFDTAELVACLQKSDPLKLIVEQAYSTENLDIMHFPYFSYVVDDAIWAERWKLANNQPFKQQTSVKVKVLVLLESNLNHQGIEQRVKTQTLFKDQFAELKIYTSAEKATLLSQLDSSAFEQVIIIQDNIYFLRKECLEELVQTSHNSTLDVISIPAQNQRSTSVLIGKKYGGAQHFVANGMVRNRQFDNCNLPFEVDLPDDDLMVFRSHVWQSLKVSLNTDFYGSLKLGSWLNEKGLSVGITTINGLYKKGLPSWAMATNMEELARQRQKIISAQQHLPSNALFSAAFSCRFDCGLDHKITAFKTPKKLPRVIAYAHDSWASGFLRVKSPLTALAAANKLSVHFLPDAKQQHTATAYELHRMQPDVLLLHHFYSDEQLSALIQYKKQLQLHVVISTDDLLTEIPQYNDFSSKIPADIATRIKLACTLADSLIVSTEALADYFSQFHNNIKVIPNLLSKSIWQMEKTSSNKHKKLRVGWAGAGQHSADIEWLIPVIEATQKYCEWVFFGDQPKEIKNNLIEFHPPVKLVNYPNHLKNLQLDVGLAPLLDNAFNQAKSNLKLLEYGALSIPVLASNLPGYANSPATLLANKPAAWISQLQKLHQNPELLNQQGQVMYKWVSQSYWLEDHLDDWLCALELEQFS